MTWLDDEPAWPRSMQECTGNNVILSHRIARISAGSGPNGTNVYDFSHHGRQWGTDGVIASDTTVVGYGDGHAVIRAKDEFRARARVRKPGRVGYEMEFYY